MSYQDIVEEEPQPEVSIEEELASLSFEEAEEEGEEEDEEEDIGVAELGDEIWASAPQLTPDAGKIRFAEDIVEVFRGGRRDRKGGARPPKKGAWRGGRARKKAGGTSRS